ncbi:hypothetical protein LTR09_003725 [Extremus antarcticus]|uniref:Uncharacterized protein n=1 Tax=Extremus antarcticus TaxID=702011 RepID=A0AAJ0DRF1_9PEZI|nr:hypothetical protein LTR09_003725 [Extremus antarcticus]
MAMDNASTKPSLPRIMEILVKDQLTRFKSPIKVGYAQMLQDYVDKLMLEPTIQEDETPKHSASKDSSTIRKGTTSSAGHRVANFATKHASTEDTFDEWLAKRPAEVSGHCEYYSNLHDRQARYDRTQDIPRDHYKTYAYALCVSVELGDTESRRQKVHLADMFFYCYGMSWEDASAAAADEGLVGI